MNTVKPKKSKKSGFCVKHNINAYPGFVQSIDNLGCYNWLRMKSFMWSGFILGLIITVTFLPVRLLFYTYVSPNWLGNLGLLSLVAALVFIAVYYGKGQNNLLGKFSMAYRQRMSRFVHHKRSIPFFLTFQAIMITIYVMAFYASTETVPVDDTPQINEFNMSLAYTSIPVGTEDDFDTDIENANVFDRVSMFDPNNLDGTYTTEIVGNIGAMITNGLHSDETKEQMYEFYKDSRHTDEKFDIDESDILSILTEIPKSFNSFSDGWSSHFTAVWLIGDIEYTALFFAYRRLYKKVDVGLPWKAVDAWKARRGGFLYPIEIIKENRAR